MFRPTMLLLPGTEHPLEAQRNPIVDLDHILRMDTGIRKNGPNPVIVSLHAIEARFDTIIAVEDDILIVKIEICVASRWLSKTHESALHNFSVRHEFYCRAFEAESTH